MYFWSSNFTDLIEDQISLLKIPRQWKKHRPPVTNDNQEFLIKDVGDSLDNWKKTVLNHDTCGLSICPLVSELNCSSLPNKYYFSLTIWLYCVPIFHMFVFLYSLATNPQRNFITKNGYLISFWHLPSIFLMNFLCCCCE